MFGGLSTREPASRRVTYFILRAYTGTGVRHSKHRKKSGAVLEKMQVNGPEGWKLARKKSLGVSIACVAIYRPTPGFERKTFKFCVLDFNLCVRSSPLQEWVKLNCNYFQQYHLQYHNLTKK